MKRKRIDIEVPIHIKKFIEKEYCQHLDADGTLKCDKRTYLGKLIHFSLQIDAFPKRMEKPKGPVLKIVYFDERYSAYFPHSKIAEFQALLHQMFRESLINYVRSIHSYSNKSDYTVFIRQFLERYEIDPVEEIDFQSLRKIYRDYITRIEKNYQKSFQ